jgi:tight adherence protein C
MMEYYDFLLAFLVFLAVLAIGGSLLSARAARRKQIQDRLRSLAQLQDPPSSDHPKVVSLVQRIGRAASLGRISADLRAELTRAGYHSAAAGSIYLGSKCILLLIGMIALPALLMAIHLPLSTSAAIVLAGSMILFFAPNIVVSIRRRRRTRMVRHHLPDVVDLLEVCVSAGMGLDMAWNIVGSEVRRVCPVLADEMELTNMEIHLGSQRVVAMRHMAERVNVEEIGSLVAMMVQSDRFGTSISDTLRSFAGSMRESHSMRAQEEAERMAVRLLLPLVVFIFPALFVVLVGPAGIQLAKIFMDK